ncbi:Rrf2 family transcriptional regulator [Peptacetobacter hominis]|uniref:Rrf2 family transcriptional regulator n=1 Tax=Peptacetobacter hominis TaxID=2743610 RepID=A0A544QSX8_9FIRM|nr:Rrf2 family transcriptional regulator [Peptacetobacter hominis]TQQ83143.1 Rrf2 family transcriptional regulator [Peptacetobacter hominis]
MLFTRESDYAIRIVRALSDGERSNIKTICRKEDIPEAFAYKIIKKLSNADIVDVKRGVSGGFSLKCDTNDITIYDIVIAIDPEFAITRCINNFCSMNGTDERCKVHKELLLVQKEVENLLKKKSLREILK